MLITFFIVSTMIICGKRYLAQYHNVKVIILIIQTNIYKSWHILSGLPEYGQGYGPPHVASHWWHAGDRGHDEADAAGRRHTRGHGHAGHGANAEEERKEVIKRD